MNMVVLALAFVFLSLYLFNSGTANESVISNDFNVTWHDCKYGMTQQMCYVDIQNLDPTTSRYFNLSVVISDTGYIDSYSTNMTMYLYEPQPVDTPIYETVEVNETRYNVTYFNETNTSTNITYYVLVNQTNQIGIETKQVNQWEPTKSNMLKEGVREKMYYGTINIPKYGGESENDSNGVIYEENGTKRFKVEWTTPIIKLDGGWGSVGKIAFWDENTDTEYHPWWFSLWGFRRNITINSTTTLTDYQVAVNITYDSDMLSNFSDGRFTDENNISMSYWLENKSDGEWAYYWVKTNLTTANGTQLMYYYGNPIAESESNGTNTFSFFDDFEGSSVNTTKWYHFASSGTTTVSGSILTLQGGAVTYEAWGSKTKYTYGTYIFETRAKMSETHVTIIGLDERSADGTNSGGIDLADIIFHTSYSGKVYRTLRNGAVTTYSRSDDLSSDYQNIRIDYVSATETKFYIDDVLKQTSTANHPQDDLGALFQAYQTDDYVYVDWVFYRKYTATEPTYSIGAEETSNTAPTITANSTSPATIYTDTDTTANLTVTDPDSGDTLTAYIQFYVNDSAVGDVVSTVVTNNTNTLVATLGSGNYSSGDNISTEYWAGDGTVNTTKANMTDTVQSQFTITLNSPVDEYNSSDNTTDFNFTVSGTDDSYSCELFLNDTGYGTNTTTLNNTATIITANSSVSDGYYDWNINCTAGITINTSEIRQITIDTVKPTITVYSPTNTTYGSVTVNLNTSADEDIATWVYTLNGANWVGFTPNTTFTAVEGNNNITIAAYDYASNTNTSSTIYFTVDTTPPLITIDSPTNTTYNTTNIDLNWSSDETLDWVVYSLNGGENTTLTLNYQEDANSSTASEYFIDIDNLTDGDWNSYSDITEGTVGVLYVNYTKPVNTFNASLQLKYGGDETTINISILSSCFDYYEDVLELGVASQYIEGLSEYVELKCYNGSWTSLFKNDTMGFFNYRIYEEAIWWDGFFNTTITASEGLNNVTIYANNTVGHTNSTIKHFTVAILPTYSTNSTNDTHVGSSILHSLQWEDTTNLSGHIFSFDNGTGTFTNDTWVPMTGTLNWSNVTKTVNNTLGTTIQWKVYANDTFNNWNESDTYSYTTTNTVPQISNITWATTSGDTDATLTYLQDIDYIIVNSTDGDGDTLNVTLSIKNPNDIYTLSNVSMTQNGDFWNYTTDFSLNLNGTWTIEIYTNDSSEFNSTLDTISVTKTIPSTFDGWFGYFTEIIPTTSNITTLVTYDYDLIGIYDNFTNFETNWSAIKTAINDSKEQNVKSALSFYFDGDYSDTTYVDNVKNNITAEFVDLKSSPYTETITMIIMELNSSGTETQKANFVNNVSQKIANATTNLFPIYVKDFTSEQLDTSYTAPFILPYNTYATESAFINQEITYLRENTTLTRIYYNLTTTLKSRTQNYHNNIILNLENIPTGTTTEDEFNVADITDDGVVVFNNESTQQVYVLNLTGKTNDIWDKTNNEILEKDTDGNFSITLNAYDVAILIFKDLNRFIYGSDYSTLYKVSEQENTYFNYTEGARSASWTVYGANDIKIELWDSSYGINNQFMIHYEYINSSYVVDYSDYMLVIIADQNGDQINNSIGNLDKTYFYISVADYEDTDAWQNAKIAEIDSIIDTYYTHIFVDGMDSGVMGDDFEIRIKDIADHIHINKDKKIIFNDYTSYQAVSDYGDADMKESFCGRWNESVNDPNYYYENISIDVIRANWARTKNKQQLLMAFGDVDDMEKMAYCYAEFLVLYGTANNNTFKYGQPNFQSQREIYTKDVGTQLESIWTETTANDWNRKFTKGTMHVDTVNKTWSFDDARSTTAELCFDLYNGASTPSAAGPLRYTLNMPNTTFNVSKVYNITYDEVAGGASFTWGTVCKSINADDITQDGKYDIRMWCGSADGTSRCNTGYGFDVGNDLVEGTGVHSWYDSNTPNYPAAEDYGSVYGRDASNNLTRNWNIYLNMNDTTSTSIDTVYSEINRSVAVTSTYLNITLDSSKDYNLTVVDNGTTMSVYDGIKVWNSTAFETIYPIESSDCDSNNPTFNLTTINGESFGACTKTDANTFVRFSVPHLSEQIIQLSIDTTPPTVDAYYQWNATNETMDLTYISDGSMTINWNVSDVSGINVSSCSMYHRYFDNSTQTPIFNYINGVQDTHQDVNGYHNMSCENITINSTAERLYYNFTEPNTYLQYTASIYYNLMVDDGHSGIVGDKIIMARYDNHTTGANKTIEYNLQIYNSSNTVAPFLVTFCNKYADLTAWQTDPDCLEVGAFYAGLSIPDSQGYQNGLASTNGSGYLGPLLITDTMYTIGSCPDCTNANNDWEAVYTNINHDDSFTSSNNGASWTEVGWEFNTYANYFNEASFEANLTVSDNLGNSINDFRFDYYGEIPNEPPAVAINTDNVTGNLISYYDIHNITESGVIWFNVSVADDDTQGVNCTFYLLNNDTTMNTTLLTDYNVPSGFGTCPYEWNTSTLPDGDYRVKVSVTDGVLVNNRTGAGFIRILQDTTAPVISNIVERNIRYSTVDLTWSTDEDANSSISISPTGTYSNNSEYTTTHSIAVSGLESNTYYTYTITTCDSNANCNTSTQSFTTASASSSGGAGGCIPIWECTPWSYCINNTQTRTCIDKNMCETNASMPDLNKTCIDKPLIIPGDNYTNFTLIDMGNYTWPWTPTDGVYHPTRLAAVISSILAHNLDETIYNIVASFGDYYYRPSFGWGILSILFMHITPFLGLYLLIGLLVRYSKIFSKSNKIIKFMIYGILIPLLVLFMTLLMPSV